MADRKNEGLWGWQQAENHNHMMEMQNDRRSPSESGEIELGFFGGSAFRITSPSGVTMMIDPWRNHPAGNWDWYLFDFPQVEVDVALSTHAHFDHDGVHQLSSSVILDRLIGTYEFSDVRITGIADKHVYDSTHNAYDWAELTRRLTATRTTPPNNSRAFDNCIFVVETGGMRIVHWGDNRPNPPEDVWEKLGTADIVLLPIDDSWHVLSQEQVNQIAERLKAHIIVPHHYGIWNILHRASTLLPPNKWIKEQKDPILTDSGSVRLGPEFVASQRLRTLCFGEKVAFDIPS